MKVLLLILLMSSSLNAGNIILDWDAPPALGITGYRVYRVESVSNGQSLFEIIGRFVGTGGPLKTVLVETNSYADSIPDGKKYFYFVTVMYGTTESVPSNLIEVKMN